MPIRSVHLGFPSFFFYLSALVEMFPHIISLLLKTCSWANYWSPSQVHLIRLLHNPQVSVCLGLTHNKAPGWSAHIFRLVSCTERLIFVDCDSPSFSCLGGEVSKKCLSFVKFALFKSFLLISLSQGSLRDY